MTQNGIIWFRLCGFSGLIYNTISFHRQKVQILQKSPKTPRPTQLPTDMDWQTAKKKTKKTTNFVKQKGTLKSESTMNCVGKETAAALSGLKRLMTLHFLDTLD